MAGGCRQDQQPLRPRDGAPIQRALAANRRVRVCSCDREQNRRTQTRHCADGADRLPEAADFESELVTREISQSGNMRQTGGRDERDRAAVRGTDELDGLGAERAQVLEGRSDVGGAVAVPVLRTGGKAAAAQVEEEDVKTSVRETNRIGPPATEGLPAGLVNEYHPAPALPDLDPSSLTPSALRKLKVRAG